MKKILIISNHSFMLWRFRRELIEALLAQGHEIVISVPFGDHVDDFRALGCRLIDTAVDRRGINPLTDCRLFAAYRKILSEEKPSLVITYSIKPNIYAGLLCRCMHIPYCANVQGLGTAFQRAMLTPVITRLYRSALKCAHTVFFENDVNAALFREKHIISAEQQCLLRGAGINLERYPASPFPANHPVRFLYLGRLMTEKGVRELFEAAQRLHAEGFDFRLDLVGFFEDISQTEVEHLQNLGIVHFHGFQQDPLPWYVAADCVVLPSWHEGMSNVLLEGAACARPLITTDIPGCREAVEPGVSGLLCQPHDSSSLGRAMKDFLSMTPAQQEAMGLAGRKRMETLFAKEQVVRNTLQGLGL
jgi:glycosyltransferase involved in cell wall biosynthesis